MKLYGRVDVYIHVFYTLALVEGGQLHAQAALSAEKKPSIPIA
jgi:hypothetical protein